MKQALRQDLSCRRQGRCWKMAELYDIWHSLERLLLYMVGVGCFASSPFSVVKVLKGFCKKKKIATKFTIST